MLAPEVKAIETMPGLNAEFLRSGQRIEDTLTPSGKGSHWYTEAASSVAAAGTVMTGVIGPGLPDGKAMSVRHPLILGLNEEYLQR